MVSTPVIIILDELLVKWEFRKFVNALYVYNSKKVYII